MIATIYHHKGNSNFNKERYGTRRFLHGGLCPYIGCWCTLCFGYSKGDPVRKATTK